MTHTDRHYCGIFAQFTSDTLLISIWNVYWKIVDSWPST